MAQQQNQYDGWSNPPVPGIGSDDPSPPSDQPFTPGVSLNLSDLMDGNSVDVNISNAAGQGAEGGAALDLGSLINTAMLDIGATSGMGSPVQIDAYDGNVSLAGELSSALGATLDHLTASSSLFDVPALDILSVDGLDS